MKERTIALALTVGLLLIGALVYYVQMNDSGFNFYKSELTINGSSVQETLFYQADQDHHTLFRNFQSSLSLKQDNVSNSIVIENVECEKGTPYFDTANNCYNNNSLNPADCLPFTEFNEYGCTFGDVYGFLQDGIYKIGADYEINPENLFKINNNYYIKFIAYSEDRHKNLVLGENLVINEGTVANSRYFHDEQVIIYIPYNGDTSKFNILDQNSFEFDNKLPRHLFFLFLSFVPGIFFFIIWHFFGKEDYEEDVPDRLSMYPNKRKAWEVAAFFNPPFGSASPNIISTLMADFYYRKIVDIKIIEKKIYIKINDSKKELDNIESRFMKMLEFFQKNSKKEGGYFLLEASGLEFKDQFSVSGLYRDLSSGISKLTSKYLSSKGILLILPLFFASLITFSFSALIGAFIFFAGIFILIISSKSTILTKFKDKNYAEYQKWQAFKKFLSSSSLNLHGYQGTVVWGEFLVYATALGTAKKVLKEMKVQGIITEEQYNTFVVMSSPAILSSMTGGFSGTSGGGGSFGGAGGGGVGGGGGGGR